MTELNESQDIIATTKSLAITRLTNEYAFDNLMLKTLYHLTDDEFADYLKHTTRVHKECLAQRKFEESVIQKGGHFKASDYNWQHMGGFIKYYIQSQHIVFYRPRV